MKNRWLLIVGVLLVLLLAALAGCRALPTEDRAVEAPNRLRPTPRVVTR